MARRKDEIRVADALRRAEAHAREGGDPLQVICDTLQKEHAHYDWVGIYKVEGDMLRLAAFSGPSETEHTSIRVGDGICGSAAKSGRTELVGDVNDDSRYIACFPSTRSEIVVPIKRGEDTIGEIDIDSDKPCAFSEADITLLEAVASSIAGFICDDTST